MTKVRKGLNVFVEWPDGSAAGASGGDPDTNLEELFDRPLPPDPVRDVEIGADAQARNIPGWASWTEEEVLTWLANNVAPEIEGIAPKTYTTIIAMARLLIALRNKTWPELEAT